MDETKPLESAIQDEAKRVIDAIVQREADEIQRLAEVHALAIEDFKKSILSQTDARIKQESSRAENRAGLDLKKFKLQSVEAFINRSVEAAVKEIRNDPRYKQFLLDAIVDTVGRTSGSVVVRLVGEDLKNREEILAYLKTVDAGREVSIVEDKSIKWGGCIVVETAGGRVFDSSIERLYFRKFRVIRREVMSLMDDQHVNT